MLPRAVREEKVRFYQTHQAPDLGHYYLFEDYAVPESPIPATVPCDIDAELLRMGMLFSAEMAQVSFECLAIPLHAPAGKMLTANVQITNGSARELSTGPPFPVNLSYHWLNRKTGDLAVFDGARTPFFPPVPGGASALREMSIIAPIVPGAYVLHLTAVQEGVRWFEQAQPGFGARPVVQIQ